MAFTLSTIVRDVAFGNQLVDMVRVTADAATGVVSTGMKNINYVMECAVSAATRPVLMTNANASGVAAKGVIGMSATANGNVHHLIVYGY